MNKELKSLENKNLLKEEINQRNELKIRIESYKKQFSHHHIKNNND